MAIRYRITCIVKCSDRYDRHTRIERIGGSTGGRNGGPWSLTQEAAIIAMERGHLNFYVVEGEVEVNVEIAQDHGRKHLKTETGHYLFDTLLALPECR